MGSQLTRLRSSFVAVGLIATATLLIAPPAVAAVQPSAPTPPPFACTSEAIATDTGLTLLPDVICSAGFALALVQPVPAEVPSPSPSNGSSTTVAPDVPCQRLAGCADADIFHVTMSGWVYDGRHGTSCAEDLGVVFMSPQTAATFAPVCNEAVWSEPPAVSPGDERPAVMAVQIALVALGFEVAVDGTYDPAMEQHVRGLQSAYGLDPNGVVGPETHSLLGTGPNVPGAPSPTTTITTTSTTTSTSPTTSTATSTSSTVPPPSGMTPGTPRACTVEAVAADTGLSVDGILECHAGWVLGMLTTTCPPIPDDPDAECETADVFHVADGGWEHDGSFYAYCAEAIADGAGMSIHTALAWSPICGDEPAPARTNITPGSRGPTVEQLQIALVALGYPLSVDGEYGPRTQSAVRDFQQRSGLEVDGIAGPDTQTALGM